MFSHSLQHIFWHSILVLAEIQLGILFGRFSGIASGIPSGILPSGGISQEEEADEENEENEDAENYFQNLTGLTWQVKNRMKTLSLTFPLVWRHKP